MRDARGDPWPMFREDRHEVLVRIALVQEHGLAGRRRDLELRRERRALRRAR